MNEEITETEDYRMGGFLLRLCVCEMKLKLYEELVELDTGFGIEDEFIFDKVWLRNQLFGENGEKIFTY